MNDEVYPNFRSKFRAKSALGSTYVVLVEIY